MKISALHLLAYLLLLTSLHSIAQSPTHVDQGTNDPSVNVWDDPEYLLLIGGIILLGFIFLFFNRRISKRKRRD